jgi:DNA-binding GntR family transcriptional regulator
MHAEHTAAPSLIEINPAPLRQSVMADKLYGILKHRVLTCALAPGARIIEKDICSEFGISRTPLRESLNRLAHEGLVVLSPFKGYSVAPLSVKLFQQMCELRSLLEPQVASLAAARATPEDIERMRSNAILEYTPGDPNSYTNYNRANSAFHLALVRSTRNPRLEAVVMGALDLHHRPTYLGLNIGIDAVTSTKEHFAIVDAIESRDADLARRLAHHHITSGEERIITALRSAGY